jgi:hypothetical protein
MKLAALFVSLVVAAYAQQGAEHNTPEHHRQMMEHGEKAMGFSQTATTHHFQLTKSGGVVAVQVNDPADTAMRDRIRRHLQDTSQAFARGDFSAPMATHGEVPDGLPEMQRLQKELSYKYVETNRGAKVVIRASNAEALKAVHEFLRYQIREHRTGDPVEVAK